MATTAAEKKRQAAAPNAVDGPAEAPQAPQTVTVRSGREVFSPVQYHSMEVGPVTVTTTLGEGETPLEAQRRCQPLLEEMIQDEFTSKMENYFRRLGEVDEFMVGRGMQPRAQQQAFRDSSSRPAGDGGYSGGGGYAPKDKPAQPVARSLGDLASAQQLGKLRYEARNAGVDPYEISKRELGCGDDELTKAAASWMIDRLMGKFGSLDTPVADVEFAGPQSEFAAPAALPREAQARVAASSDDDIPF
jgi:hypothetical protein